MKPLTKEEKVANTKRRNLLFIHNGIRSAWSSGLLKTWGDVYRKLGYSQIAIDQANAIGRPHHQDSEVILTYPELKKFLQIQTDELEVKLKEEQLPGTALSEPVSSSTIYKEEEKGLVIYDKLEKETDALAKKFSDKESTITVDAQLVSFVTNEPELSEKNNYGLKDSPNEKVSHFWFQKKGISQLIHKIVDLKMTGILLLSTTGSGKTFMASGTLRRLIDMGYHEGKTFSHIPYLVITRTTVVEQFSRVLRDKYNIQNEVDCEVINVEQLRSKAGQLWIKESIKVIDGEETEDYTWKQNVHPCFVIFDESQAAKNTSSKQSKIACAYAKLKNACIVHVSATPFTRVSEAKCFAISTHRPLEHLGFPPGTTLNEANWPQYANIICQTCQPEEYNEAAVERLMADLEPWIVRVKGIRPQFEAVNKVERIPFQNIEAALFYNNAMTRFKERKAKLDAGDTSEHIFTILQQFSIAAEECRAPVIAKRMFDAVQSGNYAAVSAVKWKITIIKIVLELEKLGVKREDISLVWGGGQTQLNKKQKAKAKIKALKDRFEAAGIDADQMLIDTGLDEVEDRTMLELPEHLRLGPQDLSDRQKEIDRFQSGKSLYCIYTFRAGGVGLSLHHTDELTSFKCRRKESGYAVEEDIPKVPVRPRKNFVAPTYSAIELVQGLGRCPRLTSLSPTEQILLFYSGTIEDDIAAIVNQKLKCLSKVVKMRESWADVITGEATSESKIQTTKELVDSPESSTSLIDEGSEDD